MGAQPAAGPAERLAHVNLTLSDDVDTQYRVDGGQSAGAEREWMHLRQYRQRHVTKATILHLAVQVEGHLATVNLALPNNAR